MTGVVQQVQRTMIEFCLIEADQGRFVTFVEHLQLAILGAIQNDWPWLRALLSHQLQLNIWCFERGIELPQA